MKLKLIPIVTTVSFMGLVSTHEILLASEHDILTGVTIDGVVQIESHYKRDYDKKDTSDFVVDEVEVGIDAQVHEGTKARISFLYEEGVTDLEIDEAILTLSNEKFLPVYLSVGQMYVPFGKFESRMISDPLTLELGETREKAALVGFETGGLYGSVYSFNGTSQDDENNTLDHYGAALGFAQETEGMSYDVGVSFINDLGDTDTLSLVGGNNYDYVNGLGVHLVFNMGPAYLIGEYITALDEFDKSTLAFASNGAEPKAWNAEVGFTFGLAGFDTTVGLAYQATEEAHALNLPETRMMGVFSMALNDHTTASLEYAVDEDYDTGDGGTGEEAESIKVQLAIEF